MTKSQIIVKRQSVRTAGPDVQVSTYDVAKRDRLIREGASPDEALAASRISEGGTVTVPVSSLNTILAHCKLPAEQLVKLLAND